jgi:hypothetical protein
MDFIGVLSEQIVDLAAKRGITVRTADLLIVTNLLQCRAALLARRLGRRFFHLFFPAVNQSSEELGQRKFHGPVTLGSYTLLLCTIAAQVKLIYFTAHNLLHMDYRFVFSANVTHHGMTSSLTSG